MDIDAAILVGHGSRAPQAAADLAAVAAGLEDRHAGVPVRTAYLELCPPTLPEAAEALIAAGHRRILVLPYFLHRGVHLVRDIPALLAELGARHPGCAFILGQHLGHDQAMIDLVDRRWRESLA